MLDLIATAAQFITCAVLILWAGVKLCRYGDVIAEKTGLGGTWIGLILMAGVTSLPELVTGASSVLIFDLPDIAAGDVIGSCLFNLVILAMLDWHHPVPLSARVHRGHVLAAAFSVVQLGLLALALASGSRMPTVGWVGVPSLMFILWYVIAVRVNFVFERARLAQAAQALAEHLHYRAITLRQAATSYVAVAVVLVAAASLLPGVAGRLAGATGLDQSFVGSLFVAITTSLPEVVVSIGAVRIGALDMAVANLFGSNLFNVAVIGFDDVLYVRGPFLPVVAPEHLISVTAAIAMTGVAVIGLTLRAGSKRFRLSWAAVAMVALYVVTLAMLGAGA